MGWTSIRCLFSIVHLIQSKEAPKISSVFQSTWVNPFNVPTQFGLILEDTYNTSLPIRFDPNQYFNEFFNDFDQYSNESNGDWFDMKTGPMTLKKQGFKQDSGPPMARLGSDNFKTIYMVENTVSSRALYMARGIKIKGKKNTMVTFYERPTAEYQDQIYICELTKDITRWAVMLRPCNGPGMKFGYRGFVSFTPKIGSIPRTLTNNDAQKMPFATRISDQNTCCKGKKFKNFKPCCHYRFDPKPIYMPTGWGEWSPPTECSKECGGGLQIRTRKCHGVAQVGNNCVGGGGDQQTLKCNEKPCGGVSGWGEWGSWDECSVSCGGGVRYRERHCHKDCVNNRVYHREPGRCNWEPCFEANVWGEWAEWSECSASCELGRKFRSRICESGPCLTRDDQTAPKQIKDCFDKYCNWWSEWLDWTGCNKECNGGTRTRKRQCVNGMAGLQGCPGSLYDDDSCNTQSCDRGESEKAEFNEFGIKRSFAHTTINSFQQDCLDFHNFFRSLHNLQPVRWDPDLFTTAKLWSKKLIEVAPESPQKTKLRTSNWPHSEIGSQFRPKDIGENISWDLSENGSPCYESVYRWYSELFYYDPANLVGRRGTEPIGHLTQMLWASSTAIGCARTQKLIKQPPNYVPRYQRSGYTVCHYAPQGNIVGLQHENWNDLDSKYCSTYDNYTGESECATGGTCQGLEESSNCGCTRRESGVVVPMCSGKCLIECFNQWDTTNYWPKTCMGTKYCTCGVKGAVCE